jgi:hypothetical protein
MAQKLLGVMAVEELEADDGLPGYDHADYCCSSHGTFAPPHRGAVRPRSAVVLQAQSPLRT